MGTLVSRHKYLKISGPLSDQSFGTFPSITFQKHTFASAPIYLFYGEHKGMHRGFGLFHIWQQRLISRGNTLEQAEAFLYAELQSVFKKADIHCLFEDIRGNHRPLIVACRSKNTVILQFLVPQQAYSVVTWYDNTSSWGINKKQEKGPRVGSLQISY